MNCLQSALRGSNSSIQSHPLRLLELMNAIHLHACHIDTISASLMIPSTKPILLESLLSSVSSPDPLVNTAHLICLFYKTFLNWARNVSTQAVIYVCLGSQIVSGYGSERGWKDQGKRPPQASSSEVWSREWRSLFDYTSKLFKRSWIQICVRLTPLRHWAQ